MPESYGFVRRGAIAESSFQSHSGPLRVTTQSAPGRRLGVSMTAAVTLERGADLRKAAQRQRSTVSNMRLLRSSYAGPGHNQKTEAAIRPKQELPTQWMNSYGAASISSTIASFLPATKFSKRHGCPSGDRAGCFYNPSFTWRSVAITASAATMWAQVVNSARDCAISRDICHRARVSIQRACIGRRFGIASMGPRGIPRGDADV